MSGEDLMVLRRMIKAGRLLVASNERESQAVAAYRSAVERVIRVIHFKSHFKVNVMTCKKDRSYVLSKKIHLSSQLTG